MCVTVCIQNVYVFVLISGYLQLAMCDKTKSSKYFVFASQFLGMFLSTAVAVEVNFV